MSDTRFGLDVGVYVYVWTVLAPTRTSSLRRVFSLHPTTIHQNTSTRQLPNPSTKPLLETT